MRVARRAYVRAYIGEVLHLITTLLLVVHVYTRHTRLGREDFDLYVGVTRDVRRGKVGTFLRRDRIGGIDACVKVVLVVLA